MPEDETPTTTETTGFDIKAWNELSIKQRRSAKARWEYLVSVIGEQDSS